MTRKIIITIVAIIALIVLSFVLYFTLAGGNMSKFMDTTKNQSLIQAIKDMYMSIYKSITSKV